MAIANYVMLSGSQQLLRLECANTHLEKKFENYIKQDPNNDDLKRKGYTAVAAEMARVVYSIIKNETNYRCYFESVMPVEESLL
jgi:hypothetical protein